MSHLKEKDGSRTSRAQVRDDNWTKFEEYARLRESVGEGSFPISTRNPLSPTSGRLHKEDMALYGREPATDSMILVVCGKCQRTVKSQAFMRHKEFCHSESMKGPMLQRVPVQTQGLPSAMVSNGNQLEGKRKVIDLDRHCGVWMESEKKVCKKSISCKIHSLEQRRKVSGRSRPLSELITEYKKNKKIRKLERLRTSGGPQGAGGGGGVSLMSPSHVTPTTNHGTLSPTSPFTPQSPKVDQPPPQLLSRKESPPHPSIACYFDDVEVEQLDDKDPFEEVIESTPSQHQIVVSEHQLYPKPAAVCSFSRRVTTGRGYSSLFNHRLDMLRSSLVSLTGREKDFSDVMCVPDASTKRKYSASLSHQRKRKYAHLRGDQNHILLAAELKFPVPQSLPQSNSSNGDTSIINSSNVTGPSATLATLPSTNNPSTTVMRTSSFYSNSSNGGGTGSNIGISGAIVGNSRSTASVVALPPLFGGGAGSNSADEILTPSGGGGIGSSVVGDNAGVEQLGLLQLSNQACSDRLSQHQTPPIVGIDHLPSSAEMQHHQVSLHSSSPFSNSGRQNLFNHMLDSSQSAAAVDTNSEKMMGHHIGANIEPSSSSSIVGNHVDHQWAEQVTDTTRPIANNTTQNFHQMKMPPPAINGVVNSPKSHEGMVQPFSFSSQQTYLLNPTQQQAHRFPRNVVPIGLGVPPTTPNASFPLGAQPLPLLYPGDKPDQGLIQLMTQRMQTNLTSHEGGTTREGGGGDTSQQFSRPPQTTSISTDNCLNSTGFSNTIGNDDPLKSGGSSSDGIGGGGGSIGHSLNQFASGLQGKQLLDNLPTQQHHHQYNENFLMNEFGISLTNTQYPSTGQYGNLFNQFGSQNSPGNLSQHSPSLAAALHPGSGLAQSSNELASHILPPQQTPSSSSIPHPSQQSSSPLHCISPSGGNQNSYLHSSQTGIVSPQSSAHRTQRVS